ncbi:MAG: serine/threonine-protein kinase [Thermoanaerobaculia bacterium]|nr:serine/threonine-protein kinase [Thermoanaerobaculia bacterium]
MTEKLGKYELVRRIGTGSFGLLYEAFDPHLKRSVAIKVCTSPEEQVRLRFYREAEIAGNLVHPNIATVHDFGFHGEIPYLVEEFLEGSDLDARIDQAGGLAYSQQLDYLIQLARGLGHAHAEGVIHRDVKPSNVRILHDDSLKILDFGVAKRTDAESKLTQVGNTVGTAAYLSPELLRGREASPASDVFAFGVVAYRLLAEERPFAATSISGVLAQILHEDPKPLRRIWRGCPRRLEAMVHRCLEKEPGDRPPSFREIRNELEEIAFETLGGGSVPEGCRAEARPFPDQDPGDFEERLVERARDLQRGGRRGPALVVVATARGVGGTSDRLESLLQEISRVHSGPSGPVPGDGTAPVSSGVREARAEIRALLYVGNFAELELVLRSHRETLEPPDVLTEIRTDLLDRLAATRRALAARSSHILDEALDRARELWHSGRSGSVRRLLRAVIPLEPTGGRARELLHLVAASSRGDGRDREAEIVASIGGLADRGRYGEAGKALRFARSLPGSFSGVGMVRRQIARRLRDDLEELDSRWQRLQESRERLAPESTGEPAADSAPPETREAELLAPIRRAADRGSPREALEALLEASRQAPDAQEIRALLEEIGELLRARS